MNYPLSPSLSPHLSFSPPSMCPILTHLYLSPLSYPFCLPLSFTLSFSSLILFSISLSSLFLLSPSCLPYSLSPLTLPFFCCASLSPPCHFYSSLSLLSMPLFLCVSYKLENGLRMMFISKGEKNLTKRDAIFHFSSWFFPLLNGMNVILKPFSNFLSLLQESIFFLPLAFLAIATMSMSLSLSHQLNHSHYSSAFTSNCLTASNISSPSSLQCI